MDDKLHLVGIGEIDSFGTVTDSDQNVRIVFFGITLSLKVPKNLVLNMMGIRTMSEGDKVKIDCLVEEMNTARTYDRSAYVASALKVKKVIQFEKVPVKG